MFCWEIRRRRRIGRGLKKLQEIANHWRALVEGMFCWKIRKRRYLLHSRESEDDFNWVWNVSKICSLLSILRIVFSRAIRWLSYSLGLCEPIWAKNYSVEVGILTGEKDCPKMMALFVCL